MIHEVELKVTLSLDAPRLPSPKEIATAFEHYLITLRDSAGDLGEAFTSPRDPQQDVLCGYDLVHIRVQA